MVLSPFIQTPCPLLISTTVFALLQARGFCCLAELHFTCTMLRPYLGDFIWDGMLWPHSGNTEPLQRLKDSTRIQVQHQASHLPKCRDDAAWPHLLLQVHTQFCWVLKSFIIFSRVCLYGICNLRTNLRTCLIKTRPLIWWVNQITKLIWEGSYRWQSTSQILSIYLEQVTFWIYTPLLLPQWSHCFSDLILYLFRSLP